MSAVAAGRPRLWAAGLLLCLLAGLALLGCSSETDVPPPSASPDTSAGRSAAAQQALTQLTKAVSDGDRERATALDVATSAGLMGAVFDNARALRIGDLQMRYVDEADGQLDSAERQSYGDKAWVGTVQLQYRLATYDTGPTAMETAVVFVGTADGARIASIGGHSTHSPLWLHGPLRIAKSPFTLVMAAGEEPVTKYVALAARAVTDVRKVLPDWRGKLVLEVPSSESELDSVLDAEQADYANIAAVTTTVDGTVVPGAPVHVFVNPRVFGALGGRGAQVVLSHESTHVATNATFASMPKWLLEGFADYVALDHAGISVQTAASQILARIRKQGLPRHLPTETELNPVATGLGATYEEAWLACRYLGHEYGEDKLIAFYRAVDRGSSTPAAFRSVLGTSEQAFVAGWRTDLARLSRVGVAG